MHMRHKHRQTISQFLVSKISHKIVYNGIFSNFELPLLVRNSTYVAQILCNPSYKVWSIFITKFETIESFILIFDISTIIHQSPWFYVVITSRLVYINVQKL